MWSARPRTALALASVVMIRSWRNSATSRFRKSAQRCAVTRPSLKPALPCLISRSPRPRAPEEVRVDAHAQGQAERGERGLDLVDRLLAQVLHDSRSSSVFCTRSATTMISWFFSALMARAGSGRSSSGLARLSCRKPSPAASTSSSSSSRPSGARWREVGLQVAGRPGERLLRGHRAVGPDLEDQLLVVGDLPEPRVLHAVRHPLDRRERGVHRDRPGRHRARGMPIGGHVAATDPDAQVHGEASRPPSAWRCGAPGSAPRSRSPRTRRRRSPSWAPWPRAGSRSARRTARSPPASSG